MENKKPVHTINYGAVRAAIWQNENAGGRFYDVSLERIYKKNDAWEITRDFRARDLLLLAKVAMDAHTWAFSQMKQDQEMGMNSMDEIGAGP